MLVSDSDLSIVTWARQREYTHYYCCEPGLPEPCLKLHLGQIAACFHEGALVRLTLQVDGELLDDAFVRLRELLALCEDTGACMPQQPVLRTPTGDPACLSRN